MITTLSRGMPCTRGKEFRVICVSSNQLAPRVRGFELYRATANALRQRKCEGARVRVCRHQRATEGADEEGNETTWSSHSFIMTPSSDRNACI